MRLFLRLSFGLSFVCLIGCVIALSKGVGQVEDQPPLRFDPDPFVVPTSINWSEEQDFDVAVVNDSDNAARIVGAEDFCGAACFSGIGLPTEIPARGRGRVIVRVKTNRPGPISEKLVFFSDQPTQPRLTMKIVGTIPETATQETSTHAANP